MVSLEGKDRECEFVLRRCLQEHPRFTPAYNSLAEVLRKAHDQEMRRSADTPPAGTIPWFLGQRVAARV